MMNPVQALLLIDTSCSVLSKRQILFSSLKILTYFSGQLDNNPPPLKWGYNFYNCPRAVVTKHRKKGFADFTAKSFADFENDISSVLADFNSQNHKQIECPAKIIEKALTEALYDYPWSKLDISSPATRKKSKHIHGPSRDTSQNFLFVVCPCPKSTGELVQFLGNENTSFLSPALRQHFVENGNVRLFWLDIHFPDSRIPNDNFLLELEKINCEAAVRKELRLANGDLIPMRVFLKSPSAIRIPTSSLMSYYMDTDAHKDTCVSGKILIQNGSNHEVCKLEMCVLHVRNREPLTLVPVGTINQSEITFPVFNVSDCFVCYYQYDMLEDAVVETKMQKCMADLKRKNLAMVVNINKRDLGVIIPFGEVCVGVCGLLYVLEANAQTNCTDTGNHVQNLESEVCKFSTDFLEPWYISDSLPEDVTKLLDSDVTEKTDTCHIINQKLRNHYMSSQKPKLQYDAVSRSWNQTRSTRGENDCFKFTDRGTKIMSQCNKSLEDGHQLDTEKIKQTESQIAETFQLLDEAELKSAVTDLLRQTVSSQLGLLEGPRIIVHLIHNFVRPHNRNPVEILDRIREEYDFDKDVDRTASLEARLCMINVLLELELQLAVPHEREEKDVADKVTVQLRTIPIHSDIATLSNFLHSTVFENYYPALDNILSCICDELKFPMPGDSHRSSPQSSLFGDFHSDAGSAIPSPKSCISNPLSNSTLSTHGKRTRVEKNPSFVDLMQVRQISLPKPKPTAKRKESANAIGDKARRPIRKARRNLFDSKSTRLREKSPIESNSPNKCFTPNGKRVLKTKAVAETPERRQRSNAILARQACLRRLHMEEPSDGNIVIQESPDKQCDNSTMGSQFYVSRDSVHPTATSWESPEAGNRQVPFLMSPARNRGHIVQHYLLSPPASRDGVTGPTTPSKTPSGKKGKTDPMSPVAKVFLCATPEKVPCTRVSDTDPGEDRVISTPLRNGDESPCQRNFMSLSHLDCTTEELSPSIPLQACRALGSCYGDDEMEDDELCPGNSHVSVHDVQEGNTILPHVPNTKWSSPSVKSLLHLTSSPILMEKF